MTSVKNLKYGSRNKDEKNSRNTDGIAKFGDRLDAEARERKEREVSSLEVCWKLVPLMKMEMTGRVAIGSRSRRVGERW